MKYLSWINNFKLSVKMMVLATLVIASLVVPTYFFLNLSHEEEYFAKKEVTGIAGILQLVEMTDHMAKFRGLSNIYLNGDASVSGQIKALAEEIDNDLDSYAKSIRPFDYYSGLLGKAEAIGKAKKELQNNILNNAISSKDAFSAMSQLILETHRLISLEMQAAGLSYDPEIASYHLIIASMENAPRLTDLLGRIRGKGAGILAKGAVSPADIASIESLKLAASYPYEDFTHNLEAAGEASDSLKPLLAKARKIHADIERIITLVDTEILGKSAVTYSPATFFKEYSSTIDAIYALNNQITEILVQTIEDRIARINHRRNNSLGFILGFLSIALLLGFYVIKTTITDVRKLRDSAINIGKYDFTDQLHIDRKDEIGELAVALQDMQGIIQSGMSLSIENARVRRALDSTSSNVMLADANRNIVYMNKAVEKMLRDVELDLKRVLPHFSVDRIIGSNMDIFHKNPAHQMTLLANLRDTYVSNIAVAGISFRLIANPIFSDSGERLGSVVEWINRTNEVKAEHELTRILGALETTTTNVMIADVDRKIIYMNKSVETMLRRAENDLRAVLPHFSVDKIVGGSMDGFHRNPAHQAKLLESLATTYTSNIVVGKRHFRLVANPIFSKDGSRLGSVVEWLDRTEEVGVESEVNKLVEAAAAGDFSERIITEGKQGFFLKLAEGLNMLVQTADKGLNDVARVLGSIAKGDLTQKIDGDYAGTFGELKNYCNDTTDSLTVMLGDIRIAADTIFTASSEIAQGNADLSSRTEQQAANLEETASSMEELTSTVRLNADNAKQANVLAEQASTVATDGGTLIQQVVSTMNAINDSARKISDIIGVIDGIAFQTNILALNAAVEAARAGDQGRGFAVVASEVRTLAQRSANAAKDIKALISDSVQKIESGNELVGKSGNTMKEIVNAIKRVNDIMSEIAAASAEQSTGIEEVSTAVSQMDEMTQQNAALVEEAAAAAESLQSQADQLNRNVAQFKLSNDQRMLSTPTVRNASVPAKKVTAPLPSRKLTPPPSAPDDEWEQF